MHIAEDVEEQQQQQRLTENRTALQLRRTDLTGGVPMPRTSHPLTRGRIHSQDQTPTPWNWTTFVRSVLLRTFYEQQ